MTAIDATSAEATQAAATALRWLNMKVNQIKPYTLKALNSATKEENGNIVLNVTLVTECVPGKDFQFNLTLNPAQNNPTALVKHQQL